MIKLIGIPLEAFKVSMRNVRFGSAAARRHLTSPLTASESKAAIPRCFFRHPDSERLLSS